MKTCSIEGCSAAHSAKGLCKSHYMRDSYARNRVARLDYAANRRVTHPGETKAWFAANPDKKQSYAKRSRRNQAAKSTGWTQELWDATMLLQQGVCALCGQPFNASRGGVPAGDHDHVTGRPRGILHARCNLALGNFEKYRHQMQAYLEIHEIEEDNS
jgi:hypothetical protein